MASEAPVDLIQDRYKGDTWRLLVVCALLNQTPRKRVEPMLDELFNLWPNPRAMAYAREHELTDFLRPLGLQRNRARSLIMMSQKWEECIVFDRKGNHAEHWLKTLPGVGPYALDSYRFFVLRDTSRFESGDKELAKWLKQKS